MKNYRNVAYWIYYIYRNESLFVNKEQKGLWASVKPSTGSKDGRELEPSLFGTALKVYSLTRAVVNKKMLQRAIDSPKQLRFPVE